jgi:hypothetical protein
VKVNWMDEMNAECGMRINGISGRLFAIRIPQSAILSLFCLTTFLASCHRYEPVTGATVARGTSIAVSLTDYGTANLGRLLGMGVGTIEGTLLSASDSGYTLSVQMVRQRSGVETPWRGEQVTIPREDVAEIRQRRFARGKSALATLAVIAAAVGAVDTFIGTGSGGQPPGGGPGPGPR